MKKEIKEIKEGREYLSLADEEIKKLAEDIYKGHIFTNKHIHNPKDMQMVFIPLLFLKEEQVKQINKNPPGLVYEYMSAACPRSINGMPIFMSFRMIGQEDAKKVFEKYEQIKKAIDEIN